MSTLQDIPRHQPDVIGRFVDGEAVLVLPAQGQVKVLNEIGGRIWELVDGSRSIAEIAAELCREYTVTEQAAQEDVVAFVDELLEKGVVSLA